MMIKHLPLCFAVLLLVMIASSTNACFVCVVPYKSLLDKVEESKQVALAHADDSSQTSWHIIRFLKGQDDNLLETSSAYFKTGRSHLPSGTLMGETARFLGPVRQTGPTRDGFEMPSSVSQKPNQTEMGGLHLLRRDTGNDPWADEGPIDRQLLRFLFGALALSSHQPDSPSVRQQSQTVHYFLPYLEHTDPQIADSAYNKIARAPYVVVRNLGQKLDSERLLGWINDHVIPSQRRSLYITLLGFCGQEREKQLIRQWIDDRWENGNSADLTVLLASHVELNGEETIRFIEQSYIQDPNRKLDEIIAAVDALRLHGQAEGVIARSRVLASCRLLLRERPALAELIIKDCTRWQAWSLAPQFMEFYAGGQQPWNNALILKYLKACPSPAAKRFVDSHDSPTQKDSIGLSTQ